MEEGTIPIMGIPLLLLGPQLPEELQQGMELFREIQSGIEATSLPTSLGQTATWTDGSTFVTLASAVTQVVTDCESAFTASTNITTGTSTDRKQGSNSATIIVGGSFTTGKAAYTAFSTLNLSAYQQLSFWIKSSANLSASQVQLSLCSDNGGATVVNSFTITDAIQANLWTCLTYNNGAALGSSIQSFRVDILISNGTPTIQLDHVIACKAKSSPDSLTLNSLISKNTAGETFWGIESIEGTTVNLLRDTNTSPPGAINGYSGTTQTVTTYKREPFPTTLLASGNGSNAAVVNVGGITLSGGWDTTNMSTQTDNSWFDGRNGGGEGLSINAQNGVTVTNLGFVRYNDGVIVNNSQTLTFSSPGLNNNSNRGFNTTNGPSSNIKGLNISTIYAVANKDTGVYLTGACADILTYGTSTTLSNGQDGLFTIYGGNYSTNGGIGTFIQTGNLISSRNSNFGLEMGAANKLDQVTLNYNGVKNSVSGSVWTVKNRVVINNLSATGNNNAAILIQGIPNFRIFNASSTTDFIDANGTNQWFGDYDMTIFNALVTGNYVKNLQQPTAGIPGSSSKIHFPYVASNLQDTRIYGAQGNIFEQTAVTDSPSPTAWKLVPTQSWTTANLPLQLSIAKKLVQAATVNISVRIQRTTTNISGNLRVLGGYISGIPSDVVTAITGDTAGQFNTFSFTVTPTGVGVLELIIEAFGGNLTTDAIYVTNVILTQ